MRSSSERQDGGAIGATGLSLRGGARPGGQGGKGRGGDMSAPVGRAATGGRTSLGVCRARKLRMEGCDGDGDGAARGRMHALHKTAAHASNSQVKTGELRLKVAVHPVHRSVAHPACVRLRKNFPQAQSALVVVNRDLVAGEEVGGVDGKEEGGGVSTRERRD